MEIRWAYGSKHTVDPEKAYRVIERIRKRDGGDVTPQAVVDASRSPRSPLHKEFEWNDSVAGERFRRIQASRIVRSLVVIREEAPGLETREFHSVTRMKADKPEGKVYRSLEDIMEDPIARDELLQRALNDALAFRKRYHALQELAQVFHAFDQFLEQHRAAAPKQRRV